MAYVNNGYERATVLMVGTTAYSVLQGGTWNGNVYAAMPSTYLAELAEATYATMMSDFCIWVMSLNPGLTLSTSDTPGTEGVNFRSTNTTLCPI